MFKGACVMATKRGATKWTGTRLKEQIQRIQKAIDAQKRANKREGFTSLTPEEIEKKLKRVNSPLILSQGFTTSTTPGGRIDYGVGIYNPDPVQAIALFAHLWVGFANAD